MAAPRFSEQQIWQNIQPLVGTRIKSLTGKQSHVITSINHAAKTYDIQYEGGSTKTISLAGIYSIYTELYDIYVLTNVYMQVFCSRLLGWVRWTAPGSAMFAILPLLDDNIQVKKGSLFINR